MLPGSDSIPDQVRALFEEALHQGIFVGGEHILFDVAVRGYRNRRPGLIALQAAIEVLLDDLQQRGLLETTLVLVMGEFGRTPKINPQLGRDHWPDCWSLLLGGGGLAGGQVIGASDKEAAYVADRPI